MMLTALLLQPVVISGVVSVCGLIAVAIIADRRANTSKRLDTAAATKLASDKLLSDVIDDARDIRGELRADLNAVKAELAAAKAVMAEMGKRIAEQGVAIDHLRAIDAEKDLIITALRAAVVDRDREIALLRSEALVRDSIIADLQARVRNCERLWHVSDAEPPVTGAE